MNLKKCEQWEPEGHLSGCDLSGRDFSGKDLIACEHANCLCIDKNLKDQHGLFEPVKKPQ